MTFGAVCWRIELKATGVCADASCRCCAYMYLPCVLGRCLVFALLHVTLTSCACSVSITGLRAHLDIYVVFLFFEFGFDSACLYAILVAGTPSSILARQYQTLSHHNLYILALQNVCCNATLYELLRSVCYMSSRFIFDVEIQSLHMFMYICCRQRSGPHTRGERAVTIFRDVFLLQHQTMSCCLVL